MSGVEHLGRMAALIDRSAVSAILIMLILIVRMLKGSMPKHTFMVLWSIVLVRLLCPWSLDVPFSLFSIFGRTRTGMVNTVADLINEEASSLYMAVALKRLGAPGTALVPIAPVRVIWCIGFVLCGALFGCAYLIAYRRYGHSPRAKHAQIDAFFASHPIHRHVRVGVSDRIQAPMTVGILRPVILLPRRVLDEGGETLDYSLMYAYLHLKQWNSLFKTLMVFALCMHWFNPLCWIMLIASSRDMEILCDALMLRRGGEKARMVYPQMLLGMQEKRSLIMPFCNGFSRSALEERISSMMLRPYAAVPGKIFSVCIVALACTVMTNATPHPVREFVEAIEAPVGAVGVSRGGEDESWLVGKDVAEGFYVVNGEANASVTIVAGTGEMRCDMDEIVQRIGESEFVIYLTDGMEVLFDGRSVLTPITRGKVISDKTATVYIGSGMFRAGASIPVGIYSVGTAPGLSEGMCLIYELSEDETSSTELERMTLSPEHNCMIQLKEGQVIEVRGGMLECNG